MLSGMSSERSEKGGSGGWAGVSARVGQQLIELGLVPALHPLLADHDDGDAGAATGQLQVLVARILVALDVLVHVVLADLVQVRDRAPAIRATLRGVEHHLGARRLLL